MLTSRESIARALEEHADFPADEAEPFAALARPSLSLRTVEGGVEGAAGRTRFGGDPDLPTDIEWPHRPAYPDARDKLERIRNGGPGLPAPDAETEARWKALAQERARWISEPAPLQFVAQFDLGALWRAGPLDADVPKKGLISVFYDGMEQPRGYAPGHLVGSTVLYTASSGKLGTKSPPSDLATRLGYTPFTPRAVIATAFTAPINPNEEPYDALDCYQDSDFAYRDWFLEEGRFADGAAGPSHRFGGWPAPIQKAMQYQCAKVDFALDPERQDPPTAQELHRAGLNWVFLAQIDSDRAVGTNWGSEGTLYLWIRRDDLQARRFGGTRVILQTC